MTRQEYIRAKIFLAASQLIPPLIRNELIADRALNKSFGIDVDAVVSLGRTGIEFQYSELVSVIKAATKKLGVAVEINDKSGTAWDVSASTDEGNPAISLKRSDQVLGIGDMALLGENADLRLRTFGKLAEQANLPRETVKIWSETIKGRPILPDELDKLTECLEKTPAFVSQKISESLADGHVSTDVLVPRSLEYYERLVGESDGQPTIQEYAAEVACKLAADLFAWRRIDGIKHALLLCGHSGIVQLIASLPMTAAELRELLEWAVKCGDATARGALIEIALQKPEFKKQIKRPLDRLISAYAGKKKERIEQIELLSASFVMVYGELSEIGIMANKPVYWQRLAAAAQAALIARSILSACPRPRPLVDWMFEVRSQPYVLHCYVDLRTDPMWLPEFGLPHQLKNECVGRVLIAAMSLPDNANALEVHTALLGDTEPSLKSQITPLLAVLSGPLEGNVPPVREMPEEEIEKMREQLVVAAPVVQSFSTLVNAALLVKVPPVFPSLATEAIQRAQYKLDSPGEANALAACLMGLAILASITKSTDLADSLFIVVRNYRRNFADELSISEALRIGLIACASRTDFTEWCKAVGAFITDFSFGQLTREEAASLHPFVVDLCNIVPELWATCGEGLAALEAVGS
jgi:hypothetical protein